MSLEEVRMDLAAGDEFFVASSVSNTIAAGAGRTDKELIT